MSVFGLSAKNKEQAEVVRAGLGDKPLLVLTGPAGTGKTLLSTAIGFERVFEKKQWGKNGIFSYTRLQEPVGKEVGFLPGDMDGKTLPYLRPFFDSLKKLDKGDYMMLQVGKKILLDNVQTSRGGTFMDGYYVFDEVQNFDNATMTTIGTRLELGAKMVLMGNFAQVDNPKLRKPENNGFYRLLKGLHDRGRYDMFDHVHLTEVIRSPFVELVENIMTDENDVDARFVELEERGKVERESIIAI